jgi:cation-transporting P-type ATPase F
VDASVIFGVVLVNAIIGFIQEAKAEKAIEALAKMVVTEATVRANGETAHSLGDLVPGDVVLLQSGDRVPADLRLLRVRNLQIEEAALTGESVPGRKADRPRPPDRSSPIAEPRLHRHPGHLRPGRGRRLRHRRPDRDGPHRRLIDTARTFPDAAHRKIAQFSRLLLYVILGLAALTFAIGFWRGESGWTCSWPRSRWPWARSRGLPAALTITLAIGVSRMARRRAIIRKLPAVETLGSTTVICSDKTGTLTQNQMTVQEIHAGGRLYHVTGSGYEAAGEPSTTNNGPSSSAKTSALIETLGAGLLCNDSRLVRDEEGRLAVQGDPTEAALIVSARKAGALRRRTGQRLPRIEIIPFESDYQYMATLHGTASEPKMIYIKGAVEALARRCSHQPATDGDAGTVPPR